MSALVNVSVGTGAAVRIINATSAGFYYVSALGAALVLGADNTVTVTTGAPLPKDGLTFQLTEAGEIWAIAKDTEVSVKVLSWT